MANANDTSTRTLAGKIVRIHESGFCFVKEVGKAQVYAFTFDKIPKYRGESAAELGLRIGSTVHLTVTSDGRVSKAEIAAAAKR